MEKLCCLLILFRLALEAFYLTRFRPILKSLVPSQSTMQGSIAWASRIVPVYLLMLWSPVPLDEQTSKSSCSIVYSSQLEHHFSTITTKKARCTSYISNQFVRPIMFVYLLWPANPLLLRIMKRILSSLSVCILLFGLHKTMKPVKNTHCHLRSNFCQQMFLEDSWNLWVDPEKARTSSQNMHYSRWFLVWADHLWNSAFVILLLVGAWLAFL